MKHFGILAAVGILASALAAEASASIVVNINQSGGVIVASYSGSLAGTDGLHAVGGDINLDVAKLSVTTFRLGMPFTNFGFSGFSGPANWGSSEIGALTANAVGDFFVLDTNGDGNARIYIPKNYIFGRQLNGSATFAGLTFATLGLKAGQYVYTDLNDTITVNIGPAGDIGAVPEPASWALAIAGFCLIGSTRRRRRKLSAIFPA